MARIEVFDSRTFVKTGHNIIKGPFFLPVATKCTAVVDAVSQGDRYAREFEVYVDGVRKLTKTVVNQVREHVNLGVLDYGSHELGIKLTTFVGSWIVNAHVEADVIETLTITPPTIHEDLTPIIPAPDIAPPSTPTPPTTDAPSAPQPSSGWDWLTVEPLKKLLTQDEINAHGKRAAKAIADVVEGIKEVVHFDMAPTPTWGESNMIPLSVAAASDRLNELSMGLMPHLEVDAGARGTPFQGYGEVGKLTTMFGSHRDAFGREIFSADVFGQELSVEPQMVLLGAGLAAIAAALYIKKDAIAKAIKKR